MNDHLPNNQAFTADQSGEGLRGNASRTAIITIAVLAGAVSLTVLASKQFLIGSVALSWCIAFTMFAGFLKRGKHMGTTSNTLAYFLLASYAASIYLNEGADWSAYVIAPAIMVICLYLLNHRHALFISVALLASISLSIYGALNTSAPTLLISTDYVAAIFVPSLFASCSLVYLLFRSYQKSHERIQRELLQARQKSERSNEQLALALKHQELLAKIQMRLQHVGKLSGWWLDIESRLLSINIRYEEGDFEVCELHLDENFDLPGTEKAKLPQSNETLAWLGAHIPMLKNAVECEAPWDTEITPQEDSHLAHKRWFRSIGEVEYGDQGINYLFGVVQDITSTKSITRRLEHQANYDDLTNLHNRRYIEETLDKIVDNSEGDDDIFYLFIDLDRFKTVNDTSGHAAGDELLRIVGKIILSCINENDIAARIGGDEFAVIINDAKEEQALATANRIREQIEAYCFSWDESQHRIGATIGAVQVDDRIESRDHLQLLADVACLDAKSEGRNRVKLSYGDNNVAVEKRENSRWLQRVQEALQNDQFALFVQEIHRASDQENSGNTYEVLLRMRTPDRQHMISPGAFLPIAERYNLSADIDRWVVKQVVEIAKGQHASESETTDSFWINLSGQSIGDKLFGAFLVDTMKEAGLPPSTINFEITETAVIGDMETAIELMSQLRVIGCQFALDDFGAGLASFGYLKKLPVDVIKIDGMFIREIDVTTTDRAFTKSIIDVAHSIGIETVAEFVENDNIRQTVTDLGVDYLQGFGIHRPEEIESTFSIDILATG